MDRGRQERDGGGGGLAKPATITQRGWKGLNLIDTRLTIDDDEVAWLENAMPAGRALASVGIYNGARGAQLYNGTSKVAFSCQLTYGAFTVPHPVTIVVFEDGAAYMRDHFNDGATDVLIGAAGTFSTSPNRTFISIWRDGPVLFIDDTAGYSKWDGATFTVIDATKDGHLVAVFEGHAWLKTAARTITYTAPNTYDNFTAASGAGSFAITDDVFEGPITGLHSTVEQLWIFGQSAIDALGNVVSTTAGAVTTTTFSVVNAVSTLGTAWAASIIGYYRSLTFFTGYSIHSLLGVTPQKLSTKLDRLFASLSTATLGTTFGMSAGVQLLKGHLVLCFLVGFTTPALALRSELLCFVEGKWFLATTPDLSGNSIRHIVTHQIQSSPAASTTQELYGVDAGGYIYRIFARPAILQPSTAGDAVKGTWTISSKLADMSAPIEGHQALKIGFDFSAPSATATASITLTLASEAVSRALAAVSVPFLTVQDSPLAMRYAIHRVDAPIIGQRLGWTLSGNCSDFVTLEAAHMQYGITDEWDTVR